ncbi:methyl-accepting chemotaxis protein [Oceanobacillus massiliensis]|uniref:methyl-accepting chemotaxis protein n=1 Tax=Oceanobacillus massiliensis TaxID=1465765 RepID=UPI00301936F4
MAKKRNRTLRQQFNLKLFIILVSITVISGILQFYIINRQVNTNVTHEAETISNTMEQGIKETDLASRAIEQQIDYRIELISEGIGEQLPNNYEDVSTEMLNKVKDQMGISGVDIFTYDENDIISVVKSTEPDEIGFTLKGISDEGHTDQENLLSGEEFELMTPASYSAENIVVLYTAQSGSREEPQFFKYAYYHKPGTDYIVSPFIEADEVYKFTEEVGPASWIENVVSKHEYAKEAAVLDPRVFADPSLAEAMYPPLEKVVYGDYEYVTDDQVLVNMAENPERITRIDEHDGEKIYKMFIPYDDGRVIYVALDYDKMSAPFKNYSLILIGFGFASLVILYLTTTRFFNKIYSNISKIISQIKSLEKGDFTARSDVSDIGELGKLSESANKMAGTLNKVLTHTREQAIQTERHAYLLESEADNSVDKVYTMSVEATTEAREKTDDINYIIEEMEKHLTEDAKDQELRMHLAKVRELVQTQSNSTTEMTITLSDLLKSLHGQSSSLSDISKKLLKNLEEFQLNDSQK